MKGLTARQQYILDFIQEFANREGMPPTVYEIADHFDIKAATAFAHVRALQRKGRVSRTSKARSLTVLRNDKPRHMSLTLSIPILGRISAGMPLLAEEHVEGSLRVDPRFLPHGVSEQNLFGLKVFGDSLRDAGVLDGDLVVARASETAGEGDLAVALVENETTVKFIHFAGDHIELRPANPDYPAQSYPAEQVFIQGLVVALQRTF